MQDKTLCIVGACRDVAVHLPQVLKNMDTIASWWKECKIVIFENDSIDDTPKILDEWLQKGGHREIIHESNLNEKFPNRIERLAYIRNRLLCYVPPFFDYMFMVDMDDVFTSPVQKSSFESCFRIADWDVMTASTPWYYDIWALRVPGLIEFDCWARQRELVKQGKSEKEAIYEAIEKYKEIMTKVPNPIYIYSAFNVGALYKVNKIRQCCRFSAYKKGIEICEHIPFQECLRSHGGKIIYNPGFKL